MDEFKRYHKSLEAAEGVIKSTPDDPNAYHNRGSVLAKLGRFADAIDSFKQAIYFKPKFARAYYEMGLSLRKLRRYHEAIRSFDRASEIKPNIPIIFDKRAAALIDLGAALKPAYSRSLFEAAVRDAERTIELSSDAEGHYNMACALSHLDRYEEAVEQLSKTKGIKGAEFDVAHAWDDPDFEPLRQPSWIERFTKAVGPRPRRLKPEVWE
ncbi:tetratricopeptide repeat protein [candidate division WOR-3 bacterium]|uniref:Tetratricopeptide repeat protein n=1 Tax=candidate division WOR-3 bacterium TaxID=2052148 RepID=A0A9D5K828_UNCW3|nr:tetratricopeptide repeat protein [candidate division WOR-3 bacterium]MBD3364143.1 tetratricopeptide repeat protein [candidate division WOR-3 bacterium]